MDGRNDMYKVEFSFIEGDDTFGISGCERSCDNADISCINGSSVAVTRKKNKIISVPAKLNEMPQARYP